MDMMMKQIPILLWGLLLPFSILQAQAVQGEITDSKQLPIEGATVVGLDAKDSSFVQGTVTREQGHFTLPLRHNGSYLLKTSAVGYKTRYIPFSITDTETAKLSRILMEEDSYALSGITVTAQKVPVEMKAEKTVYNLSATISGTQGNLYDALRQMPGVQIQSNGNILLDGQGGINVLMNGKTTYLSGETLINYLRSIPASTVEKIELINNPSSHLDAAGKTGVINIEIKRINKYFGDNHVLKNVDLQIQSNKTTVIIGSSGSGKSTLLRCINLLEIPDSGVIKWENEILDFETKIPKSVCQNFTKKTGMVFQSFNLFPHKTAIENIIEAPITVLKKSKEIAVGEAVDLLKKVGLEDKKDSYPWQLSGGQQQRIAIARALAMKPEILLFDEPTSALDPELEADVLKLIRELAKENYTILVVTHNMAFARDVSDEVVFVDKGEILAHGSYDELTQLENERIKQFLSFFKD